MATAPPATPPPASTASTIPGAADEPPDMAWRTEMMHLLHAANRLQAAGMSKLHRQDRPEPRWPVSVAVILAIVFQRLLPASLGAAPAVDPLRALRPGTRPDRHLVRGQPDQDRAGVNADQDREHRADLPDHGGERGLGRVLGARDRGQPPADQHQPAERGDRPVLVRRGDLGHERDRVRALVLGVRPGRPGQPAAGRAGSFPTCCSRR